MDNTEAVEKLAEIIEGKLDGWGDGLDPQSTAQAILAEIQADPLAYVKPKPLEWEGQAYNTYADIGPFTYSVQHVSARGYALRRNGSFITAEAGLEAAQDAAYEDLCNRVGELFHRPTTTQEGE